MTDERPEQDAPTQPTQPQGIDPKTGEPYEPVEIPVPKRVDFERHLRKIVHKRPKEGSKEGR